MLAKSDARALQVHESPGREAVRCYGTHECVATQGDGRYKPRTVLPYINPFDNFALVLLARSRFFRNGPRPTSTRRPLARARVGVRYQVAGPLGQQLAPRNARQVGCSWSCACVFPVVFSQVLVFEEARTRSSSPTSQRGADKTCTCRDNLRVALVVREPLRF